MMETMYDKDLLINLKSEIAENRITIHQNVEGFIQEIETNYSMGYNGIDWNKTKPLYYVNFNSENLLLEKINEEILNILNAFPELLNDQFIFIGDNLTELGYELSLKDFLRLKDFFISIPQHQYLWFPKIKKCINITFENELIFG